MVHCAKLLCNMGEKVLYINANSELFASDEFNSLQHRTLMTKEFAEFKSNKNFKIIGEDVGGIVGIKYSEFEDDILTRYRNWNIFIDEFQCKEDKEKEEIIIEKFKRWSGLVDKDKHLWIVTYDFNCCDEKGMREFFPIMPKLRYPLRNSREITEFVKSKNQASSNFAPTYEHKNNIDSLLIPSNMTRSIRPREIFAKSFLDGFQNALMLLEELSGSDSRPAMFFINPNLVIGRCEECYDLKNMLFGGKDQIEDFLIKIYIKVGRSNTLINVLAKSPLGQIQTQHWVNDPGGKDLLIRMDLIDGLSHDVVIIFQEHNSNVFEHNACMRATAILIVVYIPKKQHEEFCFCGICANCYGYTNKNCLKCTTDTYYCSEKCSQDQLETHKEECKRNPRREPSNSNMYNDLMCEQQ